MPSAFADFERRAPLGSEAKGNTEPRRAGTRSFSPQQCDWPPRPTFTELTLPARRELRSIGDGATSPSPDLDGIHPTTAAHGFNSKDRAGWSNEGRELFAAWILVLLGAALAVLLLASRQPNTGDLSLPRWSDPPVAGIESWAGDLSARRGGDLMQEWGDKTAANVFPEQ